MAAIEKGAYSKFAKFLELEGVCEKAKPFASGSRERWVPDVVGVEKLKGGSYRIVSAEIKCYSPLIGIGQAFAYGFFSHEVYLVIPRPASIRKKDKDIEDLCKKYGIGLVYFYGIKGRQRYRHDSFKMEIVARRRRPAKSQVDEFIELNKKQFKSLF